MRHSMIIGRICVLVALVALTVPAPARAQVTPQEQDILTVVVKCMIAGMPPEWYQARVVVTLDAPGASAGAGRYEYASQLAREEWTPFVPCAYTNPARLLVGLRRYQSEERQGWNAMRFLLHRDGKFDLTYEYPKKD